MWWINTKRIARWGFLNFWRNASVSLASVTTVTMTLFVIGALFLASAYFTSSLKSIEEQVDISVSFLPDSRETDVLAFRDLILTLPGVEAVEYRSREEELADFRQRHENNDVVLRSLEEVPNPFGARLNIHASDPSRYENIASFLDSDSSLSSSGDKIIYQVWFKKNIVDRLIRIIETSRNVGWAIVIVLVFISVVVTFNTISLAIYVSREEISLMKLVGAGNNYVRGPFVIEGVISGSIAAVVATVLLYPATIWVRNKTAGVWDGVNLVSYFIENFAVLFLLLLSSGIVLSVVGSLLAIRKHLRK